MTSNARPKCAALVNKNVNKNSGVEKIVTQTFSARTIGVDGRTNTREKLQRLQENAVPKTHQKTQTVSVSIWPMVSCALLAITFSALGIAWTVDFAPVLYQLTSCVVVAHNARPKSALIFIIMMESQEHFVAPWVHP